MVVSLWLSTAIIDIFKSILSNYDEMSATASGGRLVDCGVKICKLNLDVARGVNNEF